MNWTVCYYNESVQKEVFALAPSLLARYLRYADRFEVYGPDLGMPHTRAMGDGLFELRLKANVGIGRIFYCSFTECRIVILHQFIKKTEKTPAKELAVARRRLKEIKNAWS